MEMKNLKPLNFWRQGLLFAFLIFNFEWSSPAAPPPPPEEIQKTLSLFFSLLKKDKVDEAFDLVLSNSKMKLSDEDLKRLKNQTREALLTHGPLLNFEIVEQKHVGLALIQITCLGWSENFPLRWRFWYYRPVDKWWLVDIFVDDKIGDLFEPGPSKTNLSDFSGESSP